MFKDKLPQETTLDVLLLLKASKRHLVWDGTVKGLLEELGGVSFPF